MKPFTHLRRTYRDRAALAVVLVIVLVALLGPLLAPHSPTALGGIPFSGPSGANPLGTDELGRDVMSRILYGGRTVVLLAGTATAAGYLLGATAGLAAGFSRSALDPIIMRFMDVLLAFPPILLLLLLATGAGPNPVALAAGIALTHVPGVARVVRAATQQVRGRGYVEAAVARGESTRHLMFREILPNIRGTVAADAGPRFTVSILLVAGVNFLGLGLRPPASDWALMISENRTGLALNPWAVTVPAALIAVLTIAVNTAADHLARRKTTA